MKIYFHSPSFINYEDNNQNVNWFFSNNYNLSRQLFFAIFLSAKAPVPKNITWGVDFFANASAIAGIKLEKKHIQL